MQTEVQETILQVLREYWKNMRVSYEGWTVHVEPGPTYDTWNFQISRLPVPFIQDWRILCTEDNISADDLQTLLQHTCPGGEIRLHPRSTDQVGVWGPLESPTLLRVTAKRSLPLQWNPEETEGAHLLQTGHCVLVYGRTREGVFHVTQVQPFDPLGPRPAF